MTTPPVPQPSEQPALKPTVSRAKATFSWAIFLGLGVLLIVVGHDGIAGAQSSGHGRGRILLDLAKLADQTIGVRVAGALLAAACLAGLIYTWRDKIWVKESAPSA